MHGNDEVGRRCCRLRGDFEAVKDAIAVPEADPNAASRRTSRRRGPRRSPPVPRTRTRPRRPGGQGRGPPVISLQHDAPHLSLRSPVMILPS